MTSSWCALCLMARPLCLLIEMLVEFFIALDLIVGESSRFCPFFIYESWHLLPFFFRKDGLSFSMSLLGKTCHIFLRTLFFHHLTRLTFSQLLVLLVMLPETLALSMSHEGLAFSNHLPSSLIELDGLCLEQGWMDYMRIWLYPFFNKTCSIRTSTSFLKQDEMELYLPSSWRGFPILLFLRRDKDELTLSSLYETCLIFPLVRSWIDLALLLLGETCLIYISTSFL